MYVIVNQIQVLYPKQSDLDGVLVLENLKYQNHINRAANIEFKDTLAIMKVICDVLQKDFS